MCRSFREVLEPYAGQFVHLIRKIDQDIVDVDRKLNEAEQTVEKDMDMLLDKYQDQFDTHKNPNELREKFKKRHRWDLIQARKKSLHETKHRLNNLKSDLLSVSPPSVYRALYQPF